MLLMKESVLSFEDKTTQPRFTYFLIETNPLKIIFGDFGIIDY